MKRMKFLSFFITFALILNSLGFIMIANAADTTSGFEFTYDSTLNGLNETVNVERVNNIGGRSEAVAKITSNGASSGYIGKNYMNQTNNNTGIWALETDMYIKDGEMPEDGKISFWLNPTTGWDSIVYCRFE